MPFFAKKTKPQRLEKELATLRQRADALGAKRQSAEAELTAATEARQLHLVEGDLDDVKNSQVLQDRVNIASSSVVALEDAISAIDGQIAHIERKLDAERVQADRSTAADKLKRDLDVIEKALPDYLAAAGRFADAVREVSHFHFEANAMGLLVRNVLAQVEIAAGAGLAELRQMTEQIKTGSIPIPPPQPTAPAPVVNVERPVTERMFAMRTVRWRDANGAQQIADQYTYADLTPAAANNGRACGAVVDVCDPRCRKLQGVHGGRHPSAEYAIDLDVASDNRGTLEAPSDRANRQSSLTLVDRGPARTGTIPVERVL